MKALFTDYQYEDIHQELKILTATGAEIVDLQQDKSITLAEAVRTADAIIVQYAEMTAELIATMERCKMIIKYGIGVNNIDVAAAAAKGIYVCNVPDYGIDEVSNTAISMMMSLHRKLPATQNALRKGTWGYDVMIPIKRLSGSVLGLVGLGRIPSLVAKKMAGFGVELIACDPYVNPTHAAELGVKLVDFEMLCKESDIISIHCALTDETHHMFNADVFKAMKSNAIIINTARGPVICEADLIEALNAGEIAGAGLDTFEVEPIVADNPLLTMENVICTPHVAWYSEQAIENVQRGAAEDAARVLRGEVPKNPVNRPTIG